ALPILAHKRNPVAAVAALAAAVQAPGLAATVFGAMVQEHERAAGAWHAEWRPLRELLVAAGSAAHWLRRCLTGLIVDEAAIARNLARLRAVAGAGAGTGPAAALVAPARPAGGETGGRPRAHPDAPARRYAGGCSATPPSTGRPRPPRRSPRRSTSTSPAPPGARCGRDPGWTCAPAAC